MFTPLLKYPQQLMHTILERLFLQTKIIMIFQKTQYDSAMAKYRRNKIRFCYYFLVAIIFQLIYANAVDNFSNNMETILQKDLAILSEFPDVMEPENLATIARQKLLNHSNDYEVSITSPNPCIIFSQAFNDIQSNLPQEDIARYYLQEYYKDQLEKLLIRLDRKRSAISKVLSTNGYRTSTTQKSITALHTVADLYRLSLIKETDHIEKIIQFFSQNQSAIDYFYRIFAKIESRQEQKKLLKTGLKYLSQRYVFDRSSVNKFLEYLDVKTSHTKEAAKALLIIAKNLQLNLTKDHLEQLNPEDNGFLLNIWVTVSGA